MTNPSALSLEHMAASDGFADVARESFIRSLFEGAASTQLSDTLLELIIACQAWGPLHSKPGANNLMLNCFFLIRVQPPSADLLTQCRPYFAVRGGLCYLNSLVWNSLSGHKHVSIVRAIPSLGLIIKNNLTLQLQASFFLPEMKDGISAIWCRPLSTAESSRIRSHLTHVIWCEWAHNKYVLPGI